EQFVRKFDQVLAAGNTAGARAELEKARSLDADHPAIAKMEASLPSAAPAPPPAAFSFDSPSFVVETPAQPPSSRGTAQASDFGFTFEEEKPPEPPPPAAAPTSFSFDDGFSFDTPASSDPFASFKPSVPTPPPAPDEGPRTFDFDSAS